MKSVGVKLIAYLARANRDPAQEGRQSLTDYLYCVVTEIFPLKGNACFS